MLAVVFERLCAQNVDWGKNCMQHFSLYEAIRKYFRETNVVDLIWIVLRSDVQVLY